MFYVYSGESRFNYIATFDSAEEAEKWAMHMHYETHNSYYVENPDGEIWTTHDLASWWMPGIWTPIKHEGYSYWLDPASVIKEAIEQGLLYNGLKAYITKYVRGLGQFILSREDGLIIAHRLDDSDLWREEMDRDVHILTEEELSDVEAAYAALMLDSDEDK
jgi:hypothetical protein